MREGSARRVATAGTVPTPPRQPAHESGRSASETAAGQGPAIQDNPRDVGQLAVGAVGHPRQLQTRPARSLNNPSVRIAAKPEACNETRAAEPGTDSADQPRTRQGNCSPMPRLRKGPLSCTNERVTADNRALCEPGFGRQLPGVRYGLPSSERASAEGLADRSPDHRDAGARRSGTIRFGGPGCRFPPGGCGRRPVAGFRIRWRSWRGGRCPGSARPVSRGLPVRPAGCVARPAARMVSRRVGTRCRRRGPGG
jgi:hypothetical protein